jgi:hypothetical protein
MRASRAPDRDAPRRMARLAEDAARRRGRPAAPPFGAMSVANFLATTLNPASGGGVGSAWTRPHQSHPTASNNNGGNGTGDGPLDALVSSSSARPTRERDAHAARVVFDADDFGVAGRDGARRVRIRARLAASDDDGFAGAAREASSSPLVVGAKFETPARRTRRMGAAADAVARVEHGVSPTRAADAVGKKRAGGSATTTTTTTTTKTPRRRGGAGGSAGGSSIRASSSSSPSLASVARFVGGDDGATPSRRYRGVTPIPRLQLATPSTTTPLAAPSSSSEPPEVRSVHWFPYDRVGVVNAVP